MISYDDLFMFTLAEGIEPQASAFAATWNASLAEVNHFFSIVWPGLVDQNGGLLDAAFRVSLSELNSASLCGLFTGLKLALCRRAVQGVADRGFMTTIRYLINALTEQVSDPQGLRGYLGAQAQYEEDSQVKQLVIGVFQRLNGMFLELCRSQITSARNSVIYLYLIGGALYSLVFLLGFLYYATHLINNFQKTKRILFFITYVRISNDQNTNNIINNALEIKHAN